MRSTLFSLATCFLLTLSAPLPALGQQRRDNQRSDRPERETEVAKAIDGFTEALGRLETRLSQLETEVDRLADQPSEFSRVEVRVVDQAQRPVSGFEVELDSADRAQHASASGESSESGIALTRQLPYGKYRMNARGRGWRTADRVTVEVGKPLNLTLVAPSPDRRGTLVIEPAIPVDALKSLRFGSWQMKDDDDPGWVTRIAPEPEGAEAGPVEVEVEVEVVEDVGQRSSEPWETFPTVSDGIETVGVVVRFSVERQTNQSNGSGALWHWDGRAADGDASHVRWLVQSDGTVQPLLEMTESRTKISGKSGPFAALAPQENDGPERRSREERLGYHRLKLGQEQRGEANVALPAGQIEISVEGMYGRPSGQVLRAVGQPAETDEGELWLHAVIDNDSQWFNRILGDTLSVEDRSSFAGEFETEIELAADQRQKVSIGDR